jgi:two-component system cell cycle sensor histidine kinase/response regulator CckA
MSDLNPSLFEPIPLNDARYRAIVEDTRFLICRSDLSSKLTFVNGPFCRHHGKTREELLGQSIFTLALDTEHDAIRQYYPPPPDGGIAHIHRGLRGDGSECWVEWIDSAVLDEQGRVIEYQSIGLEVTDRMAAEAASDDHERSYKLLVEGMLHLFAVYEIVRDEAGTLVDLRLLEANQFYLDYVGKPRQEIIGKLTLEIFGNPIEPEWRVLYERVEREGVPSYFEWRSQYSGKWFEGGAYSPKPGRIAISAFDITARKQAEEELRKAKELQQAIIDSSPIATVAFDQDGIISLWNRAAERLYGWTKEEAIGHTAKWIPPDRWDDFLDFKARLLRGESLTNVQAERQRKDGSRVQIRIFTAPLRDSGGRITGVVSLMEDVTEREALLQQMRQAQKLEGIGRLAGGIAHDFNNLLTVINGYVQMALPQIPEAETLHGQLTEVLRAGERAASLTQQLLAFSRKQVLAPRPLQLCDAIRGAERMLRPTLGDDIRWAAELECDCRLVHADESQMMQVILNLAVNARDAMPDGGTITLRLRNVEPPHPDFPAIREGRWVMLEVADTGMGISEADLPHIFEPFFTTKESGRGTGLGLSTAYGIIQQSGGNIIVKTHPGQGASFRVLLPACEVTEGTPLPTDLICDSSGGNERVLLVEDRAELLSLILEILTGLGYRVVATTDPIDALRIARSQTEPFQLLVTDIVMPGLNGEELARVLRKEFPQLKVLFLSGYPNLGKPGFPKAPAGARLLNKPFTILALTRAVREVMDGNDPA